MASGEEARRPCACSSSVGLEALFSDDAGGADVSPELARVRQRLQGWMWRHEPAVLWLQRLLVWERPLHSIVAAVTLNTVFWLLSSTSLRPLFLASASLLVFTVLERWKDRLLQIVVRNPEASVIDRDSVAPRLLSVDELSHHLAESYLSCSLHIQEVLQYKRQNHGKFCAMTCSGCLLLAMAGHYIPGIMISYIILLSVLLWPLVVYHELIQKMYTGLEPILMKLDYSMKGDTQRRKHDKRKVKKDQDEGDEPRAETESESEEELSCFAPTVDVKTTVLAMAITDSELSDEEASILESGGFSVSRATTPQLTDMSEDLDQQSVHSEPEESFSKDLPEFPSVEEFPSMEPGLFRFPLGVLGAARAEGGGAEPAEDSQSPASLLIQHLASPLHFVNTHFNGHGRPPCGAGVGPGEGRSPTRSLEALSEEIVSTAISTVVQNTLSALLRSSEAGEGPAMAEFLPAETPPCPLESPLRSPDAPEESDADVSPDLSGEELPDATLVPAEDEDFELLDQSELEQMDEGLGLSFDGQRVGGAPAAVDTPPSGQQEQADQQES
ncbi:reticulophagy regulator 2 [Brachyhypopomus gauderio]|uniref:reticulophagy regulator 2 n=1 Tax=Brachyhypopomus gauderio TaxID=698409 RepID=UPI0040431E66